MSLAPSTGNYGLNTGTPDIKSIGPLAFGPEGILFAADNVGATIFAIDIGDGAPVSDPRRIDVDKIDTRLAAYLGCGREDVLIKDMAVHHSSQNVYLAVMRGSGAAAVPILVKVGEGGALSAVSFENVPFSQTAIEDSPSRDDARTQWRLVQGNREGALVDWGGVQKRIIRDPQWTLTLTDMAYVDGTLLAAGASNEEFSSTFRRIPFPFDGSALKNSLEIFHVAHGRYETASPIITFVPYGDKEVVAGYMCTPVVHFSLGDVESGTHVKGRTVAELGSGNIPVDMVSYTFDGQKYLLVSSAGLPVMKIACKDIDIQEPLTQAKEPQGVPRQTLQYKGVGHMSKLNDSYVLMMEQDDDGNTDLRSRNIAAL
jgi:hypothetical protein